MMTWSFTWALVSGIFTVVAGLLGYFEMMVFAFFAGYLSLYCLGVEENA